MLYTPIKELISKEQQKSESVISFKKVLKNIRLGALELPDGIYTRLRYAGINNLYDIVSKTDDELIRLRNFTKLSLDILKSELQKYGIRPRKNIESLEDMLKDVEFISDSVHEKSYIQYFLQKCRNIKWLYNMFSRNLENQMDETDEYISRYDAAYGQCTYQEDEFDPYRIVPAIETTKSHYVVEVDGVGEAICESNQKGDRENRIENARDKVAKSEKQFGAATENELANTSSDPEQE